MIADLDVIMRASQPLPEAPVRTRDMVQLQAEIAVAQASYEQLLRQHLTHAGNHLDSKPA